LIIEKVIRESYEDRRMEVIGEETVLAYAENIVLIGNTREEPLKPAKTWIYVSTK